MSTFHAPSPIVVNFDRGSVPLWNAPTPDMDDDSSICTLSSTPSLDDTGPCTPCPSSPRLFGSPVVVDASTSSSSIALAQPGCRAGLGVGAGGVSNLHPYLQYPPVEVGGPRLSSSAHGHLFMPASGYGAYPAQLPESQCASVPFHPTVPQDACPDWYRQFFFAYHQGLVQNLACAPPVACPPQASTVNGNDPRPRAASARLRRDSRVPMCVLTASVLWPRNTTSSDIPGRPLGKFLGPI
ncbi:hypothetical protein C8Q74DRAFT_1310943, partial [Fomes fomentarius]